SAPGRLIQCRKRRTRPSLALRARRRSRRPTLRALPCNRIPTIVFPPGANAVDLLERLREHRRQEEHLAWQGTFAEYYELVKANPRIAAHAHARLYAVTVARGGRQGGGRQRYRFFARALRGPGEGLERLVAEYFRAAAGRLDVRKRRLLLKGPAIGGKSTIVTLLKRG